MENTIMNQKFMFPLKYFRKYQNRMALAFSLIALIMCVFLISCNKSDEDDIPEIDQGKAVSDFNNAIAQAKPGTEIIIPDGEYTNAFIPNAITKSGTSENPIVIKPATPEGVVFKGNTCFTVSGSYIQIQGFKFDDVTTGEGAGIFVLSGAKNCRITGNYFRNSGSSSTWAGVVDLKNHSQDNRIDYNTFENVPSIGVRIFVDSKTDNDNSGNKIDHNYFRDISFSGLAGACVQLGQQTDPINDPLVRLNTTVEYNLFENVTFQAKEIVMCKTSNNVLRYNTFKNCGGGLTLRAGIGCMAEANFFISSGGIVVSDGNNIVRNNYFYGSSYASIILSAGNFNGSSGTYRQVSEVKIMNNTIISPTGYGIILGEWYNQTVYTPAMTLVPTNCAIVNNIIVADKISAINDKASSNILYQNNIINLKGNAVIGVSGSGSLLDPALFYDTNTKMYRLPANSSAINGGIIISGVSPATDIDNEARTGNPDVGADEYYPGTIAKPLESTDVGVSW